MIQGDVWVWQGIFTRWKRCNALAREGKLAINDRDGVQLYLFDIITTTIIPIIDDPLRILLRSGKTIVNIRVSSPEERIKWVRALSKIHNLATLRKQEPDAHLLDKLTSDIWKGQSQLSDLVIELLPKLKVLPKGAQTATKIIRIVTELKRNVAQAVRIVHHTRDHRSSMNQTISDGFMEKVEHPQTKSSRSRENGISRERVQNRVQSLQELAPVMVEAQPNKMKVRPEQIFYETPPVIWKETQETEKFDEQFHSFIDEGYDGINELSVITHTNDYIMHRSQSFPDRDSLKKLTNRLQKKKIVNENPVFRSLANPINSEAVRTRLPAYHKSEKINLFKALKGLIGPGDFFINLPIQTHQPLTTLHKLCQQMIFEQLLVKANQEEDAHKRLLQVLGFAVSTYACTEGRVYLPLKPLKGQTYQYIDPKYRFIAQQVTTDISAFHCQSQHYVFEGTLCLDPKFKGNSLQLVPKGYSFVYLKGPKQLISFTRCQSQIKNIILGKLQLANVGEITLTDDKSNLAYIKFKDSSLFDTDSEFQVTGWLKSSGVIKYSIQGYWNQNVNAQQFGSHKSKIRLWENKQRILGNSDYYNFNAFTYNLNNLSTQLFDLLPATDSRFRPDVRGLQYNRLELAEQERVRLYDRERDLSQSIQPLWFSRSSQKMSGEPFFKFNGKYWLARQNNSWEDNLNLFDT